MIEKVRVSLWDIFTFFMSGFLVTLIVLTQLFLLQKIDYAVVKDFIFEIPAPVSLFLFPLICTLLGMLLEPIANYFDKIVINPLFKLFVGDKQKHRPNEVFLENYIKNNLFGELNGQISNPFPVCKEYVETKQLSSTFMIFLSRYGFYRNAAFLSFLCCFITLFFDGLTAMTLLMTAIWLVLGVIFKWRAEDFYSYQAPSVYYAFLIDKITWKK